MSTASAAASYGANIVVAGIDETAGRATFVGGVLPAALPVPVVRPARVVPQVTAVV